MKKSVIILSGLVILLAVGVAGGIFYFLGAKKAQKQEQTSGEQATKDPISNLKFDHEAAVSDPIGDLNGPFYHKVYKAESQDGITFSKTGELVAEKASVPDAVMLPSGRIIIYMVDGAGRSNSGLMLAASDDKGKTWKQGSLQIKSQGKFSGAADPQAVLLEDGSVRLFYLVFSEKKPPVDETGKPMPTGEKQKIKSATSKDGVNFTEEEGSRFEMTEIWTDPDVVKIGSKWFMYLSEGSKNIALTSDDGSAFAIQKAVRTDGAISKTIKTDEGKYRQFFCKAGISSAETLDGLNFSNEVVSLEGGADEIICDPTPVKIDGKWLLFYKVAPPNKNKPNKPPL